MKSAQLFILVLLTSQLFAQSLPSQWQKSDDNHILKAGGKDSDGLYDESNLEEVRIYFTQTNYWTQLTQNYSAKKDIVAKMKYKGVDYDSIGVRFKGQTSYSQNNSQNNSQKKSFNISMDFVKSDQNLGGYKTLNLNNSFQDASFMREVLYFNLIRNHSPAAKSNFVRLYINDQDWGIYQNVQQLNKTFLKEWYESNDGVNLRADSPTGITGGGGGGGGGGPMWGDGTAAMNYLGTDTSLYQKYYTLKSSGKKEPWNQLIQACNVLNTTPINNLEQVLPDFFDIDKILWHLACEIAFVDDDSYVYKGKMDYYLYQDAETGRFSTYDYDANSVMVNSRVTWSPFYNSEKVNYPLLNKILAVPAYRQRYLAHMRTIIKDLFDDTKINDLVTKNDNLIRAAVMADPKKITTNTQYNNELNTLKTFMKNRKVNLLANAEVKANSPIISTASHYVNGQQWARVNAQNEISIKANVSFSSGLNSVNLHYGEGLSVQFIVEKMYDDGTHGDAAANDGIYGINLGAFKPGTLVKYYIEAVGNDASNSRTYFPSGAEHQVLYFNVEAVVSSERTVVINEFMATNMGVITDEFGETEDWIELYNTTSADINISGYFITDNVDNLTKFEIPANTILKKDSYLILWADEDKSQGPYHTNFKLSASGEKIILSDKNNIIIDSITFGPQTPDKSAARIPNGTGPFVIGNHTFNANNSGISSLTSVNALKIKIYPNPASQIITVETEDNAMLPFKIYNQLGQLKASFSFGIKQIDVSTYEEGMYFLQCGPNVHKLMVIK